MNQSKTILIVIAVAVAAGIAGYVLGVSGGAPGIGGDAALRAKLDEVKKLFPPLPDSNFVFGRVKSVSGNVIILDTPPASPFDESPRERQITVTDSTKIIRNENKSLETLRLEGEVHQREISSWGPGSTGTPPTPPLPFVEKEISVSDIQEGDELNVEADGLIRMAEKFEAVKITVQLAIPAPPLP